MVILPGNPGVSEFYITFARRLYERLGGTMSVRMINLAGFVPEDHYTLVRHGSHIHKVEASKQYSLKQQCAFVKEYLQALTLQLHATDELARGVVPNIDIKGVGAVDDAESKRDTIRRLLSKHIPSPSSTLGRRQHRFILACHSIGAYIGLETMRLANNTMSCFEDSTTINAVDLILPYLQGTLASSSTSTSPSSLSSLSLPSIHISHSFLIFPFIRMDLHFVHYWLFKCFIALPRIFLRILIRMIGYIPMRMWKILLKLVANITSEHSVKVIYETFTNHHIAEEGLYLAVTEFQDVKRPAAMIKAPSPSASASTVVSSKKAVTPSSSSSISSVKSNDAFDLTFLSQHIPRVTLYYAGLEPDMWGPKSQMDDFHRLLPDLDLRYEPRTNHAWCAYVDQSLIMAENIAKDIETLRVRWMVEGDERKTTSSPSSSSSSRDTNDNTTSSTPTTINSRL